MSASPPERRRVELSQAGRYNRNPSDGWRHPGMVKENPSLPVQSGPGQATFVGTIWIPAVCCAIVLSANGPELNGEQCGVMTRTLASSILVRATNQPGEIRWTTPKRCKRDQRKNMDGIETIINMTH